MTVLTSSLESHYAKERGAQFTLLRRSRGLGHSAGQPISASAANLPPANALSTKDTKSAKKIS